MSRLPSGSHPDTFKTMLSVVPQHPQEHLAAQLHHPHPIHYNQQLHYKAMPHRVHPSEVTGYPSPVSLPTGSPRPIHTPPRFALSPQEEAPVAQALEIARESPDGAQDPTVAKILEGAISTIWARISAEPGSYVMTRNEFAVFNFFQHRFLDNKAATAARARYWDNAYA